MGTIVWLILIVLLICNFVSTVDVDYCKPAEEGKPFSVSFRTQNSSDVYWHVTYSNGTTEMLSLCPANRDHCLDVYHEFTGDHHLTGRDVTHSLVISHVNSSHHQMTLSASASASVSDVTNPLYSCRMDVYTQPRDEECHAVVVTPESHVNLLRKNNNNNQVTPYRVNVTYTASGVFPNVSCQMNQYEVNSRQSQDIPADQVQVRLARESGDYCSVTCDAEFSVDQPGVYVYTTVVKPHLAGNHEKDIPHLRPVNSMRLDVGRTVHLHPPPSPAMEVCEDEFVTVQFVCEARDFLSEEIFSWSVGGEQISSDSFTSTKFDSHLESILTLRVSNEYHNKVVVCQARDKSMKFAIEKSHTLKLIHPPKFGPTFEDNLGNVLGDGITYNAGKKTSLNCVAKGGYPEKGTTEVECYDEVFDNDMTNIEDTTFKSETNRVNFELLSPENQTFYCQCKFNHVSKCQPLDKTYVKIRFLKLQTSQLKNNTEQLRQPISIPLKYFILAVSSLLSVLLAFVALFVFMKKKTHKEDLFDSKGRKHLLDSSTELSNV